MIKGDDLFFKTNVQLKSIIGKDLINDDNIAILELVKNAFDADAKKVDIVFSNLKNNDDDIVIGNNAFTDKTSRIIIKDDGVGMDLIDIRDKWLNIAYSEKKTNSRQHNRMMAGAKGVGRFSCDRLGEYLNLFSKKESSEEYIKLFIDWKAFEIDDAKNKEIQSIPIEFSTLNREDLLKLGIEPIEHGVILEIIKIRSQWVYPVIDKANIITGWNIQKFLDLKKYLEKLINPNQAFENNDFGIYLNAPEFIIENETQDHNNKFIGKIENRIFEKLDFQSTSIESEIQSEGKVLYTILKDKGKTIFWIKENNSFFPNLKNVKTALYYLNPYSKAFFTKQTGIRSFDYGSVFLFVNGFRVPPYGELGNDWLLLDQRKSQGYARYIGNRDIVGRIEVLDNQNDFQIISSREGVVRNESYKTLVNQTEGLFYKIFRRLEKYVVDGLNWDSIPLEENVKISEIEKKIIAGETKDSDLSFREDDLVKSRRVYSAIHSIISAKPEEVIELYINEGLISQKIAEEREQSEREFEQLITDFENKKIDADTINRILQKKALENKALEKQINEFSKYSTAEITSKAILELQNYKKENEEKAKLIDQLKQQLDILAKEKNEAEKEADKTKTEIEEVKKELTETKSQNLFLKSIKSQEFDDVLNLMHHIGISTGTIQNYIKGAVFKLENDIPFEKEELKNVFSKLNYELNKIYSISKFATKANFKVETKDTTIDIISFIEQYIINIVKPFLPTKISLIVYEHNIKEFITTFKPIEFIIILDNLINNSRKAIKAKEETLQITFNPTIEVSFTQINADQLQLSIKDNGIGIPENERNKIFDYGFTTTEGSGLGLTHVKELVDKIGGTIILNSSANNGAEFVITINKK